MVPARTLGLAIRGALKDSEAVDLLCPARLVDQRMRGELVDLEVHTEGGPRNLATRLLVAADGGESAIRKGLGIQAQERPYGHDAIITTVTPDRPQPGVAFERFTGTGPLALLPMTQGRYSVVWTCREDETAEILALRDGDFLARLQGRFGQRLGRVFKPATRRAYPLKLLLTREMVGHAWC